MDTVGQVRQQMFILGLFFNNLEYRDLAIEDIEQMIKEGIYPKWAITSFKNYWRLTRNDLNEIFATQSKWNDDIVFRNPDGTKFTLKDFLERQRKEIDAMIPLFNRLYNFSKRDIYAQLILKLSALRAIQ